MAKEIKNEYITDLKKNILIKQLKKDMCAFDNLSLEEKLLKTEFLNKYRECEVYCKTIMKCYKDLPYDGSKSIKLYWSVIEKSIKYFNENINLTNLKKIFGDNEKNQSETYAKEIRNSLEHTNSKKYLEILKNNKEILFKAMDNFIKEISDIN